MSRVSGAVEVRRGTTTKGDAWIHLGSDFLDTARQHGVFGATTVPLNFGVLFLSVALINLRCWFHFHRTEKTVGSSRTEGN